MNANRYLTPGVIDFHELNQHTVLIGIFHLDEKQLIFLIVCMLKKFTDHANNVVKSFIRLVVHSFVFKKLVFVFHAIACELVSRS